MIFNAHVSSHTPHNFVVECTTWASQVSFARTMESTTGFRTGSGRSFKQSESASASCAID